MMTFFSGFTSFSKKKRIAVIGTIAAIVVLVVAVPKALADHKIKHEPSPFMYTPNSAKVTNDGSFSTGAASYNLTDAGLSKGIDDYTYYFGSASAFPTQDKWVSFNTLWSDNKNKIASSCYTGSQNTYVESLSE